MSNEFVTALSASVNAGAMILNDYLLEVSDIEGGHRLTITRGSEVQTMDVLDGGGGGGSGIQSDWNQSDSSSEDYVKNRPCYYEPLGDTLAWNGEEKGEVVQLPLDEETIVSYSHISGSVPTPEQLQNCSITLSEGTTLSGEELMGMSSIFDDGFALLISLYIIVVPTDNYTLQEGEIALSFPKKGIYMTNLDDIYPAAMTIPGFEFGALKQLDVRLLPGYDLTYSNSVIWDGVISGRDVVLPEAASPQFWVHVSDELYNPAGLIAKGFGFELYIAANGSVTAQTIPAEEAAENLMQVSQNVYMLTEYMALFALCDGASFTLGEREIILPRRGVYYLCIQDAKTGATSIYLRSLSSAGIQVVSGAKLQDAYLPASVQRVGGEIIMNSFTTGSTKRFVLRVDDTGALTTTEITA